MCLKQDPQPCRDLVEWASGLPRMRLVFDRPWWYGSPPPAGYKDHSAVYLCHCLECVVAHQYFNQQVPQVKIYLGQCWRCQAVVWSIQFEESANACDKPQGG